ncbi:hypothetical protein B1H10_05935 [candidate division KSB1 bacterium 4484_188]|nr:MAG: hypothetical protein B1H10_05935 [candidate division KSB1 bacterium 4484_188]HFE62979.1 response regulator transcription factor [Caldithrix sp.]
MILLASKNSELSNSFIKDVEHEGFPVVWLEDLGQVITRLYQNKEIRMVVIDLESYHTEVNKFFRMMKKDANLKYIPLICMVKKDMIVEHLIAFELGADDFLYLPYTSPELQLKMRSIQRLLELQNQLKEKESQLKALRQAQSILVTLSHYINNALTPLYTFVQMMNEKNPDDAHRLRIFARRTVEFINKVLKTLNDLVQSGEMRVIKDGAYKNLMLDIESELKKLQNLNN